MSQQQPNRAITILTEEVYSLRPAFESVLADRNINFDREAGFAIQLLTEKPSLRTVAMNNRGSLLAAVTNVAAIGITLNPASKLAYLLPRKISGDSAIVLDISYMGLIHIAVESGAVRWAQARLVHEGDVFRLRGIDKEPVHEFDPKSKDRGPVVGAYVVAKTPEGDYLTEWMDIGEIEGIRDRSDSYKAYLKDKQKTCPWVTDPGEMQRKTVVKRASKYWPRRERLDKAVHYLNTDAGEGLSFTDEPPSVATPSVLQAARAAADKGRDAFAAWWKLAARSERGQLRNDIRDLEQRCNEADRKRTIDIPTPPPKATSPHAGRRSSGRGAQGAQA